MLLGVFIGILSSMHSIPTYSPDSASLYIHIPFCRKACHYCDFHFSTNLTYQQDMVDAICSELMLRGHELDGKCIETIYFGGGTPSVLTSKQLILILNTLKANYNVDNQVEITLEANPDDLSVDYIKLLRDCGINRLSIGLQSFDESELKWMNRSHTVNQSYTALDILEDQTSIDYSIDLIFGSPLCTDQVWSHNLNIISQYRSPHISCYNLTVEPNTALHHQVQAGQFIPLKDDQHIALYHSTHKILNSLGYEHYEISNYAKDGKYSRHNTGYWMGNHYLGIGPGAHSYNGKERSWNVANNALYLQSLKQNTLPREVEVLSNTDKYNERVMVGLRTMWGIHQQTLHLTTEQDLFIQELIQQNLASLSQDRLILTESGRFQSDHIASQLFREE